MRVPRSELWNERLVPPECLELAVNERVFNAIWRESGTPSSATVAGRLCVLNTQRQRLVILIFHPILLLLLRVTSFFIHHHSLLLAINESLGVSCPSHTNKSYLSTLIYIITALLLLLLILLLVFLLSLQSKLIAQNYKFR